MLYNISLLPGDGIGKEISNEALKILNWINNNSNLDLKVYEDAVGGESIDKYETPFQKKL